MINTLHKRYVDHPSPYTRECLFLAILQLAQLRLQDEDRAQIATLKIFKGLNKYKPDKPFLNWVNQILKYNFSDGQQVSNKEESETYLPDDCGSSAYYPDLSVFERINVNALPAIERELCYLVLEGHTLTTAAMKIGISYPAAVMRLKRLGNKLSSEKTASYS
jgi:hypothetical protein